MNDSFLSTGDAAVTLGVTRDALTWALRHGAPEPRLRIAGRRIFDADDIERLREWLRLRRSVNRQVANEASSTAVA